MDDIIVMYVLPDQVPDYWGIAGPMIYKAAQRFSGHMDLNDVYSDLIGGGSLLWLVSIGGDIVAAMTTKVIDYPKKRSILVDLIGGKRLSEWMPVAIEELKRIGAHTGVTSIEANGRKGFERIAPKAKFKPIYTHYEMEF